MERKRERERNLHIKWTGNEPGYVESVGKSDASLPSLPAFLLGIHFRLHSAQARTSLSYRESAHTYMYIYIYVYIRAGWK